MPFQTTYFKDFEPMKPHSFLMLLLLAGAAHANDSMGTVSTSGIKYLKNPHIDMQSEDLYISEHQIRVHYRFKNTSSQDLTETVLFPLPIVPAFIDYDFADTKGLVDSFRIYADGKPVRPQTHVRAYFERSNGSLVDVTADLKKCGLTDQELMHPWTQKQDGEKSAAKSEPAAPPKSNPCCPSSRMNCPIGRRRLFTAGSKPLKPTL